MTEIRFGCGEYSPGTKRIPPGGGGGGGGGGSHKYDPVPPVPLPKPGGPPPVEDYWVCQCDESTRYGRLGCDETTRQCVLLSTVNPVLRRTRAFLSRDACINQGYAEEPCSIVAYRCEEVYELCPDNETTRALRECIYCGRLRDLTAYCNFPSDDACRDVCQDEDCPQDPPDVTGIPGTDPEEFPGVRLEGPITPTTWYGCVGRDNYCEGSNTIVSSITYECDFIATTGVPQFPYIYRTLTECQANCGFTESTGNYCVVEGPTTGFEDPPPGEEDPGLLEPDPDDPGAVTTFQRLPEGSERRIEGEPGGGGTTVIRLPDGENRRIERLGGPIETGIIDLDLQRFTQELVGNPPTGDDPYRFNNSNIINIDEFFNNNYMENSVSSGGSTYHRVYNIFNYEDYPSNEYADNILNLEIFERYIPEEVAYLLKNKNSNIEWSEKYALGVNKDKLIKSLKPEVYSLFKRILDVDGKPINIDYFLGAIKRHLVNGTIDNFDISYFYSLVEKQRGREPLTINLSQDPELNRRAALGFLAAYANSIDAAQYNQLQEKIEAARRRYLLSDIEAQVILETETTEEFPLFLEDAGLSVLGLSAVEEHVPTGPGDGYYFVIETIDGQELPLELDTAVSAAYVPGPDIRKLVLSMMGEDSHAYLTASASFDDSELGAGYQLPYTASAMYFKLDLTSLKDGITSEPLITNTEATYVKLTDADEIKDHSTTYGARSSIVNIQYDDPILQYMDRSGIARFTQKDLTFRNFTPSRSSGDYSIVTRSLPDILVINPVASTEDNIFNGYSDLNTVLDSFVERRLRIGLKIDLTPENISRPAISPKLTYEGENSFQIGLVGIKDTQNIYYPFDQSKFSNTFTVSKRSPVGHVYYNVIEGIKQKYRYSYITWWDVYRRLKLTEYTSFVYSVPVSFLKNLETGFKGYRIRSVLQRENAVGSNLILRDGQEPDTIILSEEVRNSAPS